MLCLGVKLTWIQILALMWRYDDEEDDDDDDAAAVADADNKDKE